MESGIKHMNKKTLATIIIGLSTFVLGGIGIFTAVRMAQLRGQAVAPNAPESQPLAWDCARYVFSVTREGVVSIENKSAKDEVAQNADVFINDVKVSTLPVPALLKNTAAVILGNVTVPESGVFGWKVIGSKDCDNQGQFTATATPTGTPTATPTGTPTATPTGTPTATPTGTPTSTPTSAPSSCELNFTISSGTGTPTPTATPKAFGCDVKCNNDTECRTANSNYVCHSATLTCRHVNYPDQSSCQPPATSTSSPTPVPNFACNSVCSLDSECKTIGSDYSCISVGSVKRCRADDAPNSTSCTIASTSSTPVPVELPAAGVNLPSIFGLGAGFLLIAVAVVFLL